MLNWVKVITNNIRLAILTKVAPLKGNLVYEYNPFYNYRINLNMYEYKDGLYSLADLWNNFKITLKCKIKVYSKDINEITLLQTQIKDHKENLNNLEINSEEYKTTKLELKELKSKLKQLDLTNNYDNSSIKYYEILPSNDEDDYKKSAKIIVAAYKKGRNADRINLEIKLKNSSFLNENAWYYENNNLLTTNPVLREAGELTDFITNELSFDLEHPVQMLPLYSYDGSVNLILNDGKNTPKLINSRFSATGKNTYEVCDRKGNNDTNIYDQGEKFEIDTSLYKQINSIPKLKFVNVQQSGNLKIGNYHFYFKLSDADGNESDFVAESGLVSIFIGQDDYFSVSTGLRNDNSNKQVYFQLSNIDASYDYVHVYYSRYTSEENYNSVTEYIKINKNYIINNASIANIYITGSEDSSKISAEDINLQYNIVNNAYTSAICQNRLFLANINKSNINYSELLDLSLRILPYLKSETYTLRLNERYELLSSERGYIDPVFIYNKTGYWTRELYRFGIVYIMKDNTLSPVFNIRGGCYIREEEENDSQYSQFNLYDNDGNRLYISIDEENYFIIKEGTSNGTCLHENSKGVVMFSSTKDTNTIFSVNMKIPYEVKLELSKHVKGYFFVRLQRVPFVLAQGITIGIDKESGIPTIPTKNGIISDIYNKYELDKTHICVQGNNEEVIFASEGFVSRYKFHFKRLSSAIWKQIGKIVGVVVAIVAVAVATIYTCGAAGAVFGALGAALAPTATAAGTAAAATATAAATAAGATAAAAASAAAAAAAAATSAAIAGSALATALVAGATIAAAAVVAATITATVAVGDTIVLAAKRLFSSKSYNRWETEIPDGYEEEEDDDSRKLTNVFSERLVLTAFDLNNIAGIICPDYSVNLPLYNLLFVGGNHLIMSTVSQGINILNNSNGDNYFTNDDRHFYIPEYYDKEDVHKLYTKIVSVHDDLKVTYIDDMKFRARAGEAEEAFRIECIGNSYKSNSAINSGIIDETTLNHSKVNSDIVRGSFGPYLAFYDKESTFLGAETVNIYTAGYDSTKMELYVYQRAIDNSVFSAISDRFELNLNDNSIIVGQQLYNDIEHLLYRGDCYICQFTHRLNRNFTDPATLYNDEIIDINTWKDNYTPGEIDKLENINRNDVNAIQLGMWITFRIRSSNNLNIRTEDYSMVEEYAMSGHPRTYFPKTSMQTDGVYKTPDSEIYNQGFSKKLSERYNFEVPDVPYIKNWFGTRIMYSNLNVSDSFQNGFRVFKGLNYRDYTREYGNITKLISFESSLLCVFEHGIALIPVNERTVAGNGPGGSTYINTNNVLPDNPKILSDTYGSQWADSVLKIPNKFGDVNTQYVYGVDICAKKIWRTDGNSVQCISDMRVQEFLNNNITLSEFELTPKLGIRNVKTFYNAFKRDVMFTFYDNTYGFEEKVWNLCWNELLNLFVTFYSWVPAVMENINNIPFSFNRNTTKWIAKLGTSHSENSFADGITLSNVILTDKLNEGGFSENYTVPISFELQSGEIITEICSIDNDSKKNFIGFLSLSNRTIPDTEAYPDITYSLEPDLWDNRKMFEIKEVVLTGNVGNGKIVTLELLNDIVNDKTKETPLLQDLWGLTQKDIGKFVFPTDAKFPSKVITIYALYLKSEYSNYDLMSELYYRNKERHNYADESSNRFEYYPTKDNNAIILILDEVDSMQVDNYFKYCIEKEYPIYKNKNGYRENLDEPYNRSNIVTLLNIKASIDFVFSNNDNERSLSEDFYNMQAGYLSGSTLIDGGYYESTVAIIPKWNMQFLSTLFWKHGQAGIFDIADKLFPTYWYGEQHPFEFEFIVANEPGKHKIFDNLLIISNNAEPESFHYEIIGDSYEFAKDKVNMYIRQEATKELYQNNGFDITFNRDYKDLEEFHRPSGTEGIYDKSTILPIYYGRQDTINEIYDSYNKKNPDENTNFSNLAGAELILYRNLDEIRIWNHSQAVNIDDNNSLNYGNMRYKEDLWNIQINPINYVLRNEEDWGNINDNTFYKGKSTKVPIELHQSPIPTEVLEYVNNKNNGGLEIPDKERGIVKWTDDIFGESINLNKEVKIKDKWLKVRIRYSGKKLAIINAINTLYSISYS